MHRGLFLMLALGGCDRVYGLERPVAPPVCGPFGAPEEVMFANPEMHDLSVDNSGTRGFVLVDTGGWNGPHAVVRGSNGVWQIDPARDKANLDTLNGAHAAPDGTAYGWIEKPRSVNIDHYLFNNMVWEGDSQEVVEDEDDRDAHVGNVIYLPIGSNLVQKFLVEIRPAPTFSTLGELRILEKKPIGANNEFWKKTGQAGPLREGEPKLDMMGGGLTADHEILVYSARVAGEDVSRLFASRRDNDLFDRGVELIIEDFPPNSDFTEPWINGNCTQLYFRSGGATWFTTAVAQ